MKKPYFLEPTLPSRVQKYMSENKYIDVDDMAEYLIKNYKEFRTKKKNVFVKSVWKAYKWELQNKDAKYQDCVENADSNDIYEIDTNGTQRRSPDVVEIPMKNTSPPSFCIDSMYKSNTTTATPERLTTPKYVEDSSKVKRKRKKVDSEELQISEVLKKKRNKFEAYKPTSSLEDMRGIDSLHEMACLLATNLCKDDMKLGAPKCVLLSGPQGSGKTMFATCFAGDLGVNLLRVPVSDLTGNLGPDSESSVKEAFRQALFLTPCVLLLENLEVLSSKEHGYSKGPDKKICDQIQSSLIELESKNCSEQIIVIAETRNPQNIDLNLRTLFKLEVFMPILDKQSRVDVLTALCSNIDPSIDFEEIALRTSSFVAGDLNDLVQKTRLVAWKRTVKENLGPAVFKKLKNFFTSYSDFAEGKQLKMKLCDFYVALPMITPTLKREGFPMVPDTTWEDVGGLQPIKSELMEKILWPMEYGDLHEKFRAKKPNGIMLWGPPGCGKTLLAKAVANHAGVNLYAVMGPELLNMYQGESERAIREVFKRAASVAPCVIFFDEFDCICPRRSGGAESGSKMTIVNTLLVEMNGFNQRKDVYVMAATNRPDMVDPAVLRPERFDTSLYVGLPDRRGRIAVFNACTKDGTEPKLAPDVNVNEISDWCENFSGADCAQLVYMASKEAIAEEMANSTNSSLIKEKGEDREEDKVGTLFKRHFVAAIKRVSPSVGIEEQRKYLRMKLKFENSRKEGKEVVLQETTDSAPEEKNKNK